VKVDLAEIAAPQHTAIVTQECQGAVVGPNAGLAVLAASACSAPAPPRAAAATEDPPACPATPSRTKGRHASQAVAKDARNG